MLIFWIIYYTHCYNKTFHRKKLGAEGLFCTMVWGAVHPGRGGMVAGWQSVKSVKKQKVNAGAHLFFFFILFGPKTPASIKSGLLLLLRKVLWEPLQTGTEVSLLNDQNPARWLSASDQHIGIHWGKIYRALFEDTCDIKGSLQSGTRRSGSALISWIFCHVSTGTCYIFSSGKPHMIPTR